MKKLNVAIVGATGAVGQELLKVMAEHNFPYAGLKLLATKNSAGKIINFQGKDYVVEETTADSFDGVDLALFAGGPASREFGRLAQSKGVVVIDNSSTFRLEPDVPLIIPEVNGQAAKNHQGLIANPNCSTILMVGALYPLYKPHQPHRCQHLSGCQRRWQSRHQRAHRTGAPDSRWRTNPSGSLPASDCL